MKLEPWGKITRAGLEHIKRLDAKSAQPSRDPRGSPIGIKEELMRRAAKRALA